MAVGDEEGVVSEAAFAFGFVGDDALDGAIGGGEGFAIAGEDHDAAEATGAFFAAGAGSGEFGEEFLAVVFVGGIFACVSGGVDAGGAVEGIDFDTGVIGEDEGIGGEDGGCGEGFDGGVGFEGVAVFDGGGDLGVGGEVGDRVHEVMEDRGDFFGFMGVLGGDDEGGHGGVFTGGNPPRRVNDGVGGFFIDDVRRGRLRKGPAYDRKIITLQFPNKFQFSIFEIPR